MSSAQGICCKVSDLHSGSDIYFVAVYGFNTIELRRELWNFIDAVCGHIQSPEGLTSRTLHLHAKSYKYKRHFCSSEHLTAT